MRTCDTFVAIMSTKAENITMATACALSEYVWPL